MSKEQQNKENQQMLENRKNLQLQINDPSTKVNIDRSVFTKTEDEKQEVREMKSAYKKAEKVKQALLKN